MANRSLTWLKHIVLVPLVNRRLGVHRDDRGDDAKENDGPKGPHACFAAIGRRNSEGILQKNPTCRFDREKYLTRRYPI